MKNLILALLVFSTVFGVAQHKEIEVNDIWKYYRFYAQGLSGLKSMNDGVHYTTLKNMKNGNGVVKHKYETGEVLEMLIGSNDLSELSGTNVQIGSYQFSADESKIL